MQHFVEKESAELQGAHSVGLTAGHSDLIKFESVSSAKFVPVKVALFKMVQTAKISARKRALLSGERLLPQKFVNQVRQSLAGVDMSSKFRAKAGMRPVMSWVESETAVSGMAGSCWSSGFQPRTSVAQRWCLTWQDERFTCCNPAPWKDSLRSNHCGKRQ